MIAHQSFHLSGDFFYLFKGFDPYHGSTWMTYDEMKISSLTFTMIRIATYLLISFFLQIFSKKFFSPSIVIASYCG